MNYQTYEEYLSFSDLEVLSKYSHQFSHRQTPNLFDYDQPKGNPNIWTSGDTEIVVIE